MYQAIKAFVDGENGRAWPPALGGLRYAPGDPYPREGFQPTDAHIAYLLGKQNRFGAAVIRELAEDGGAAQKKATTGKATEDKAAPGSAAQDKAARAKETPDKATPGKPRQKKAAPGKAKPKGGEADGGNGTARAAQTPPEPDGDKR